MNKQILTTGGAILAAILILGGLIWYYGNTRYEDGKSSVYLDIAQGKYDRDFTYFIPMPAPKPVSRTIPGTRGKVDSVALDSLKKVVTDKDSLIETLAQGWGAEIRDSTTYTQDSLSVTVKGTHAITVDPIGKVLHDFFAPEDIQLPVRVEQKVILRDPTFWQNLQMILYGTAIGALIVTLIHAL